VDPPGCSSGAEPARDVLFTCGSMATEQSDTRMNLRGDVSNRIVRQVDLHRI